MSWEYFLLGAVVALLAGLDRTAALQIMISRPIVAGPLTGWLLGQPQTGLLAGMLIEFLWLARLPVGATIPPDDTQVTVGGTVLAASLTGSSNTTEPWLLLLALLVALPLGKVGQLLDRGARHWNGRLLAAGERSLAEGALRRLEFSHLWGLGHFGLSSLGTYTIIAGGGFLLLDWGLPLAAGLMQEAAAPLRLILLLVGISIVLGTINVNRMATLFGASFSSALLMLWLL